MAPRSSDGSRQPTVREVAIRAGVSPMTVSRTLAGGKNVRPEVQKRVLKAVEELGYHRNENARSLRAGQATGLVGVAITNLGNPYYGNFALGVDQVAARFGRRILLGNTGEDPARERQLIADFIGRQVEGIILVPSGENAAVLQPDALNETPLVLASRLVDGVDADAVLLDDVGGAYRGTRSLLAAGHRRIGYLGNVMSVFTGQRRFAGFGRALAEYGLEPDPALTKRGQQDVETARVAMAALLDLPEPPTAVFSANNRNTIGALGEIGDRLAADPDTRIPDIVAFDNFELAPLMPVPLTIVDHDAVELGREAARLLFRRLTEDLTGSAAQRIELSTRLLEPPVR